MCLGVHQERFVLPGSRAAHKSVVAGNKSNIFCRFWSSRSPTTKGFVAVRETASDTRLENDECPRSGTRTPGIPGTAEMLMAEVTLRTLGAELKSGLRRLLTAGFSCQTLMTTSD